ncbi:MAG: hypothetical protein OJJ21_13405 [Ferrovibrio sp.]|uniref:hypothetical protein n=1 Tax=Ferrovibrio sp. TaxID=1917215 RepID=UPI0026020C4A|nr:hypothetical protein [Ferrovibrio sp.]MCW0234591.1 hypothetical protein [Ferrovibrio sp.]
MNRFILSLRRVAALAILVVLTACTAYSLVPAATTDVANFRVENDIAWNKANKLRVESAAPLAYWTADGPALNYILFVGGVKDGGYVLRQMGTTETVNNLVFRNGMSATEIVELWEASMTKMNTTSIAKGSNIQPADFGGTAGFKFDFQYVAKDEVDRSGVGYAAVKDGKLYLIFFSGTKLHHFPMRRASALRIMESAKITG